MSPLRTRVLSSSLRVTFAVELGWRCFTVFSATSKRSWTRSISLSVLPCCPRTRPAADTRSAGLLLSSFTCLPTFPVATLQSLDPSHATTLSRALTTVRHYLESTNPNLQILALRCLNVVPVDIWVGATEEGWEEAVWAKIMGFLQSRDAGLRKEVSLLGVAFAGVF